MRLRSLLPRDRLRPGVRALALLAVGYGLARLLAPGPDPQIVPPAPPRAPDPPAYVSPGALPWNEQAADLVRSLDAELGPGRFEFVATAPPFIVALERSEQLDRARGDQYAEVLRALHQRFLSTFQAPLQLGRIEAPLPVVVYASAHPGVMGRYDYAQSRIRMVDHPTEWRRVLAHEATHQLLHGFSRSPRLSPWLQEGVAMLFETGDDPKAVNRARRAGWRDGAKIPLIELASLEMETFWDRLPREGAAWARTCYAESWGLAYYLLMKHRAAFHTLLRLELDGRGGLAALERIARQAGFASLDSLESEWLEFMHSLP